MTNPRVSTFLAETGMRARGKVIGAEMEIHSASGKGKVVRVKLVQC